jgi:hypothetical protein
MHAQQDWIFIIRGREIIARVEMVEAGGGILRRYSVSAGPSQVGLEISVPSKVEASAKIEELVTLLLGPNW